jgi:hypothetical protein
MRLLACTPRAGERVERGGSSTNDFKLVHRDHVAGSGCAGKERTHLAAMQADVWLPGVAVALVLKDGVVR